MENKNAEIIRGLREYADFLEAHPNLPEIYVGNAGVFYGWRDAKAAAANVARAFGKVNKEYDSDTFRMEKTFCGGIGLVFTTARENVCERIQVGVKVEPEHIVPAREEEVVPEREVPVYEWHCSSILAAEEEDAAVV